MRLNGAITKLKVALLVALSFCYLKSNGQNINEFFMFNQTDKSVISTGTKHINDSTVFGIASQLDSSSNICFNIFSYDLFTQTVTSIRKIDNKQDEFRYIQTLPPQIDFLGRVCHAFSNDKQSEGRNGEFIIFNPQTNELIDSIYKSPKKSGFSSFIQKPDSTFLLFGTSTEFDPNGDFYLMHVGQNGEFLSDTTYGHTAFEERGYAIAATPDGGFVFTGMRRTTLNSVIKFRSKIAVYKIDAKGAVEWSNLYGGDLYNVPYQIKVAEDSNIYIVGLGSSKTTTTENYFNDSPYLLKLLKNGKQYSFNLDTNYNQGLPLLGKYSNLLIEGKKKYCLANWYYFIDRDKSPTNPSSIHFFNDDSLVWKRYLFSFTEPESSHELYSIEKTLDGGFLMGGTIEGKAPDPVGQYGWIVKTDSLGCVVPGCHLVGVPNLQGQIESNMLVYPNPSNNAQNTWLSFALPKTEAVTVTVTNLNGQAVKQKDFGLLPKGNHQMQMDITLASGIYFIKLQTPTLRETVKWVVE